MRSEKLKGFTLIELIVVIAIVAALAAIIVLSVIGYTYQARAAVVMENARNVYNGAKLAVVDYMDEVTILPGEIYIGDDSGTAYAVGGSDDLSVGKFMGDDFSGHYAFKIADNGLDVEFAVWCKKYAVDQSDVKKYSVEEIEQDVYRMGIGSYPTK